MKLLWNLRHVIFILGYYQNCERDYTIVFAAHSLFIHIAIQSSETEHNVPLLLKVEGISLQEFSLFIHHNEEQEKHTFCPHKPA